MNGKAFQRGRNNRYERLARLTAAYEKLDIRGLLNRAGYTPPGQGKERRRRKI